MAKIHVTDEKCEVQGDRAELMSMIICVLRILYKEEVIEDDDLDRIVRLSKKSDDELKKEAIEKLSKVNELLDKLAKI